LYLSLAATKIVEEKAKEQEWQEAMDAGWTAHPKHAYAHAQAAYTTIQSERDSRWQGLLAETTSENGMPPSSLLFLQKIRSIPTVVSLIFTLPLSSVLPNLVNLQREILWSPSPSSTTSSTTTCPTSNTAASYLASPTASYRMGRVFPANTGHGDCTH
jgi:hypothetical protein